LKPPPLEANYRELEETLKKERRRQHRLEEGREISMLELDALTVMLIAEVIIFPIMLLFGDLVFIDVFAIIITVGSFTVFLAVFYRLDKGVAEHGTRVTAVAANIAELKRAKKGGRP